MNKIFTVAILGCGGRGAESYGRLFLEQKDKYRIVALCDLLPEKLEKYGEIFDVANENRFLTDEEFFEKKRADLLVVSTLERLRQRPAGAEGGSSPQSGRRKKRAENRLRVRVRQPKYLLSGVQKRIRTPSPARRRNKRRINRCKKTRQFSTQRYCKSAGNPSCGLL